MGNTGSGKSTTIQFLAGSKMVKKKIEVEPNNYIDHICAQEPFPNEALKSVISNSEAKSETRYINPISVNLKDIDCNYEDKTVIICDSPGFGDTGGVEVDIANGIEAIKESKSVRPVFLFSYLRLGDKGEGIRELAHFLIDMITDIKQYKKSFSFLFTKFPSDKDIHATLLNIKKSITDSDAEVFNMIMKEMLDKTKNAKPLNPLEDKAIKLIEELFESDCIRNPKAAFKFSITKESRAAIDSQTRLHQLSIIEATKSE